MNQILEAIVRSRPDVGAAEDEPGMPVEERDRALRAIASEIMADPDAAFRPEPVLAGDFQVRCRIGKIGGAALPMAEIKFQIAAARAGLDATASDGADWARALALARTIPDDLQAVYLILAAAALRHARCPSDAEVARRCGMHSAGRARSRIKHLDKGDLVVTRSDMSGNRIAVLPDLGWETMPGDPNEPAVSPAAPGSAPPSLLAAE